MPLRMQQQLTRLSVKLMPAEHCSTQPAAVSKTQPNRILLPSLTLKLLLA